MKNRTIHRFTVVVFLLGLGGVLGAAMAVWARSSDSKAEPGSRIISREEAREVGGDWGKMHIYLTGETFATTNAFTGLAVIKPGQTLHPAHRHAEEEYLVITEGKGRWHLAGEEYPAQAGDVLYVEPWVMHGLVNTGEEPLTFFVVKYGSKGVAPPPEPPGDHGR